MKTVSTDDMVRALLKESKELMSGKGRMKGDSTWMNRAIRNVIGRHGGDFRSLARDLQRVDGRIVDMSDMGKWKSDAADGYSNVVQSNDLGFTVRHFASSHAQVAFLCVLYTNVAHRFRRKVDRRAMRFAQYEGGLDGKRFYELEWVFNPNGKDV